MVCELGHRAGPVKSWRGGSNLLIGAKAVIFNTSTLRTRNLVVDSRTYSLDVCGQLALHYVRRGARRDGRRWLAAGRFATAPISVVVWKPALARSAVEMVGPLALAMARVSTA
jgi:hypothetical protein